MRESLAEYCGRTGREALLAQWDRARNGDLSPGDVAYGSKRKVWWRCEHGHSWQAMVKARTSSGSGCPVCAGRALVAGVNDLASVHPELAAQWHPTRNRGLTPGDVLAGARKRVWWRCERGHEWEAAVSARTQGTGCPVCAGKAIETGENDLASLRPDLAAQWHPDKNGALTPADVTEYSNRRVWWRCELGHEYRTPVCSRTLRGSGCPVCAGRRVLPGFNDLATLEPRVAAQWHPALNGGLTPDMVTAGSRRKVWWQCESGHSWQAVVYSRTGAGKNGCPVCAGRVRQSRHVAAVARPVAGAGYARAAGVPPPALAPDDG